MLGSQWGDEGKGKLVDNPGAAVRHRRQGTGMHRAVYLDEMAPAELSSSTLTKCCLADDAGQLLRKLHLDDFLPSRFSHQACVTTAHSLKNISGRTPDT